MTFRSSRLLAAVLPLSLLCGVAATVPGTAAEVSVDFTVHESFQPAISGRMTSSDIEGCSVAKVTTLDPVVNTTGNTTTFTGTKVINCGDGNSFNLRYKAKTSNCDKTDSGTWKVTRGAGIFATAKGEGKLVGTHTLGSGFGTFCEKDGINDHYTGKLTR